jgi:phosphoribosylglycinamide formyltransferase 2
VIPHACWCYHQHVLVGDNTNKYLYPLVGLLTNKYLRPMHKKILLLGSGELGKELVIALKRLGQTVIAVDSYAGAPAMQVADGYEVIDMLNGQELDKLVFDYKPDLIVPEIEAIRTERFYEYEKQGIKVIPSAKAANFTMNRKLIRDLAAKELGLRTANYFYATQFEEFNKAVDSIGLPCVVKPLMSSSGKGQSVLKSDEDRQKVWDYAINNSRGDIKEVIIEEFIAFHTEITLLTVTQQNGPTLFCPPIGHRQERGDYQESWQPVAISDKDYTDACAMAEKVTTALTGSGIWGVEFFLTDKGVYFSELSPRPHDTGMVTLAGTKTFPSLNCMPGPYLAYRSRRSNWKELVPVPWCWPINQLNSLPFMESTMPWHNRIQISVYSENHPRDPTGAWRWLWYMISRGLIWIHYGRRRKR